MPNSVGENLARSEGTIGYLQTWGGPRTKVLGENEHWNITVRKLLPSGLGLRRDDPGPSEDPMYCSSSAKQSATPVGQVLMKHEVY